MTKKLAIVVPALNNGGGVPAVARFIRDAAIRSGKYEVKMVSLCTSAHDETSVALTHPKSWIKGVRTCTGEWDGFPYTHVGSFFCEFEFQRLRRRRVLDQVLSGCDLIQIVCGSPACANSVFGLGKPVAVQVATRIRVERRMRDQVFRGFTGWWRKFMTVITDRMDDRAFRRADTIQVENNWMLDYARTINGERKFDLIYAPPGIDASLFTPSENRNLGEKQYILSVARFDDLRKNATLLLESFARLPKNLRDTVELKLAGASEPPGNFWRRARLLGVANRVSYIARPIESELIELYQNASLFALPSDEEGLGIVVLEAMSCGVPVVSTLCGGPEGIISDSEDGFLVPLNDAALMSQRMKILLMDHEYNRLMGIRARRKIVQKFEECVAGDVFVQSWDRLVESQSNK